MTDAPLIAGIELGGTKCVVILARGPDAIEDKARIPTTRPEETMNRIEAVLDRWRGFAAIGIASFGPISIDRDAGDYGHVMVTAKPQWSRADIARRIAARYPVPVGFHTDVVGAALGEARWGAAKGVDDLAYVTVGTGVGVGLIAGGKPVDGLTHAELGHMRPPRSAGDDWTGSCPFHGACVEGLASGAAIAARSGTRAEELPADRPAWEFAADALGNLLATLVLTGIPRRIVMGGGVMVGSQFLFPRVRAVMKASVNGYVAFPAIEDADTFVVPAALGDNAGPLGAIVLGAQALGQP